MPTSTIVPITASTASLQAKTDAAGAAVTDVNGEELRLYAGLLSPGVVQTDAWKVAPGTGLGVTVGSSVQKSDLAVVQGTGTGQGRYLVRLDSASPFAVALAAADLTNPRVDEVYLVVSDNAYDAGGRTLPRLAVRQGDPSSTPANPGPDASWKAYLLLARIAVAAGASSVVAGNITDLRPRTGLSTTAKSVPGVVEMFAGPVIPSDALLCNGQAVSRTTYAALFAAIGTTWGAGDGSSTFNVPDFRDRYPRGASTQPLGASFGSDLLPNHLHTVDPPNTTSAVESQAPEVVQESVAPSDPNRINVATDDHTHAVNIASFNSGNPTSSPSILPASKAVHFIIWT